MAASSGRVESRMRAMMLIALAPCVVDGAEDAANAALLMCVENRCAAQARRDQRPPCRGFRETPARIAARTGVIGGDHRLDGVGGRR